MSRQVTHDGAGAFQVRFPFDRSLVDQIKTLPHRRWNASECFWSVPEEDVVSLVEMLQDKGFRFDAPTRKLYQRLGGELSFGNTPPPSREPTLPGLFDDVENAGAETGTGGDYTVGKLNASVREAI